jgi:hypothetical protein
MSADAHFTVILHHLAPDVKQAGTQFADAELTEVKPRHLRKLLEALAVLAPTVKPPVVPSLRISGPHGQFLVQVAAGQVRVTSWSTQAGAENLTPDRILALIMGAEVEEKPVAAANAGIFDRLPRSGKIALLAVAILGSNAVTAWMMTRPPPALPESILPAHRPIDAERAKRVLAEFAGDYAMGNSPGDRALTIGRDGKIRWVTLGAGGVVTEEHAIQAESAESRGHAVLVTDNFGMIEMKDAISVVYFGDTYRRKTP